MRILLLLAPLAAGILAACAPTVAETRSAEERQARDRAKVSRALAGLTPGQAQNCLSGIDRRTARVQTIGGTLLFRVNRNRVFRNDMNGSCATSAIDPIFVTQTPTTALCRGDIAQLIDRASRFPIGACSYGDFVPYTRAK
ncbi:hypothetical protein [Sphingomonas rubra]|uniref:Uncharacterized protein n=1 Tax=Sphingomonas rubra TaxID=634430 RepID=A0A1I5U3K8_9SPHN|nr:hypothetical protein [Sphingomonas rubra]SFP89918.1 hypothetical protein SAMN04488241_11087 [Sphingomonas rubra]